MGSEFMALYSDDPAFYDDLPPTPMAEAVRLSLSFSYITDHVHVITQMMVTGNGGANESKLRWLNWLLEPSRNPVTIHQVMPGEKKSAVLQRHCRRPDAFCDDSMKHVIDVMTARGVAPKQYLLPRLGHNNPAPEVSILALLSHAELSYYGQVHNPLEDEGSW
jgi:hypothetical protein